MRSAARAYPTDDLLRDAVERQHSILKNRLGYRELLNLLGYALSSAFIPMWVAILCWSMQTLAEYAGMFCMEAFTRRGRRVFYDLSLGLTFLMEFSVASNSAVIWFSGKDYSQPFAVGLVAMTFIQLTTLRTIHLPYGMTGLAAVCTVMIGVAAFDFLPEAAYGNFVIATLAVIGGTAYSLMAMRGANLLHRTAAEGQASAQAANAAKDRFLAHMSHELRTPLNAIIGLSQTEAAKADDTEIRKNLGVITESAKGLSVLLDDVLDMAAVRAGKTLLRPVVTSVPDTIVAVADLFRPLAVAQGVSYSVDFAENPPNWAEFDPNRLRQCLSNLLSNAVKHTQKGRIGVQVSYYQCILIIDVADNGPGIAADRLESIFDPFSANPSAISSTGLGLSISRTLARQMGGDLTVKSTGPGGTTFRLTLRIIPTRAPKKPAATPSYPQLAGLKILVVDDIASNRLVAASHLGLFGAEVIQAASGAEAVRRVHQGGIAMVLLDKNMPDMDGPATLRALRAGGSSTGAVPVLAMTAANGATSSAATFFEQVDGVIHKPFTTDAIAAEIMRVMQQQGMGR